MRVLQPSVQEKSTSPSWLSWKKNWGNCAPRRSISFLGWLTCRRPWTTSWTAFCNMKNGWMTRSEQSWFQKCPTFLTILLLLHSSPPILNPQPPLGIPPHPNKLPDLSFFFLLMTKGGEDYNKGAIGLSWNFCIDVLTL